jgi:hypothetical protein
MANVGTVNAGAAGPANASGSPGNQPGSSLTVPVDFRRGGPSEVGSNTGQGVSISAGWGAPGFSSSSEYGQLALPGRAGAIIVFENTGT